MRSRFVVPLLMALLAVPLAAVSATPGAAAGGIALLTEVQAQDMGDFDRVTFTFEGGTPVILQAEYVTGSVNENPSGEPVVPPVGGDARIIVTMSNASGVDLSVDPFVVIYTGPKRFSPDLPKVVELVEVEDFEATLQWIIAIRGPQIVAHAQILSGPTRVVVDVPHTAETVTVSPSFTG